jgi:methylmalonyl-CoA/ethylmalonyl-CoA epimerase
MGGKEERMVLPPPAQVGVMFKKLDEAIAYYSETFGLGPFQTVAFVPAQHWLKGEPCPIKLNIGMCPWGTLQFELIEPVEGDAPHKWFLQKNGEGLQHLGFIVDNYDEWLAYLKKKESTFS